MRHRVALFGAGLNRPRPYHKLHFSGGTIALDRVGSQTVQRWDDGIATLHDIPLLHPPFRA
jgi:hypothetical protein